MQLEPLFAVQLMWCHSSFAATLTDAHALPLTLSLTLVIAYLSVRLHIWANQLAPELAILLGNLFTA